MDEEFIGKTLELWQAYSHRKLNADDGLTAVRNES